MERVHGDVDKAFDARSRAHCSDDRTAIGIDCTLDHDIGQAEQAGLDTCRDADMRHVEQAVLIQTEPTP